jgi:uncharacterized protein with FMN-binding domain
MALTTTPRLLALGFAGLGLTAVLAGCSTAPDGGTGTDTGTDSGSGSSDTGVDESADTSAEYADGSYSAEGEYVSPAGPSTVLVEITIQNDSIAAVTVTPEQTDPTAKGFQTQFANGIADVIVGRDIDILDVSRVGGSSLTSGGFNDALEKIKAEALVS